jgi:hypothetical protein
MAGFNRHEEAEISRDDVWHDDAFGTLGKYAEFLTNALVANEKPFVLNVNGDWGTGKTFFVRRWAAFLRQQDYPVVEYNAWENDSEDDPLTSLLAVCAEQLKTYLPDDETLISGIKKKGGRVALRLGGIAAKAALRKILGNDGAKDVCDLFSEDTEKDLIELGGALVEEQIKKQQERKSFIDELTSLVAKLEENEKLPIFVFIDELDRCRPTFAIELLERVKHLFGVDGMKFVISTHAMQLSHSIRGVYGEQFDGQTYLQRFFDETFTLPQPDAHQFAKALFAGLEWGRLSASWHVHEMPAQTFAEIATRLRLTLRQQLQVYHRVMAVVDNISASPEMKLHFELICLLVMLRYRVPEEYRQIMSGSSKLEKWRAALQQHGISLLGYSLVSSYLTAMDMDTSGMNGRMMSIRESASSGGHDKMAALEAEFKMLRECCNNYYVFVKYPEYVELTDTLS